MILKGATSQACAACKHQRRKCTAECPLAAYFPPDQPKLFQNAHKLFGVRNILNILKQLDPRHKQEAMKSIIYQANVRDKFPVYGCWEVIWQLQYLILVAHEELQAVQTQLAMYRHQHHIPDFLTSQLELGMAPPNNPSLPLFNHYPQNYNHDNNSDDNNNNNSIPALPVNQHQQQSYSNSSDAACSSAYNIDSNVNNNNNNNNNNVANPMWIASPFVHNTNDNNNENSEVIQSQLGVLQYLSIHPDAVQDYDELHPFFNTIDDSLTLIPKKLMGQGRKNRLKTQRNQLSMQRMY